MIEIYCLISLDQLPHLLMMTPLFPLRYNPSPTLHLYGLDETDSTSPWLSDLGLANQHIQFLGHSVWFQAHQVTQFRSMRVSSGTCLYRLVVRIYFTGISSWRMIETCRYWKPPHRWNQPENRDNRKESDVERRKRTECWWPYLRSFTEVVLRRCWLF